MRVHKLSGHRILTPRSMHTVDNKPFCFEKGLFLLISNAACGNKLFFFEPIVHL